MKKKLFIQIILMICVVFLVFVISFKFSSINENRKLGFFEMPFVNEVNKKTPNFLLSVIANGEDMELKDKIKLNDILNRNDVKVVMLHFFASWCDPSTFGLKSIEKIYDEYRNKGLIVLLIASDSEENLRKIAVKPIDSILKLLKEQNIKIPVCWDKNGNLKRFFGSSIPRTIIIDKNKVIRWSIVGASTDMYIKIKELVVSELY